MAPFSSKQYKRGFSLLEMSIVIILMSIMISITASVINKENERVQKARETNKKMEKIEKAINLYIKKYRRLPCPADYTKDFTEVDFGKQVRKRSDNGNACTDNDLIAECRCVVSSSEQASGMIFDGSAPAGAIVGGMIPVRDLGLPDKYALDPWNNRMLYFTVSSYGTVASRFITSHDTSGGATTYGGIQIKNRHGHHLHPPEEKTSICAAKLCG